MAPELFRLTAPVKSLVPVVSVMALAPALKLDVPATAMAAACVMAPTLVALKLPTTVDALNLSGPAVERKALPAAVVVVTPSAPALLVVAPEAAPWVTPSAVDDTPLLISSRLLRMMFPAVAVSVTAVVLVAVPMVKALPTLLNPMPPLTPPVPAVTLMLPLVAVSVPAAAAPVIDAAPVISRPLPVTLVPAVSVMPPEVAV